MKAQQKADYKIGCHQKFSCLILGETVSLAFPGYAPA